MFHEKLVSYDIYIKVLIVQYYNILISMKLCAVTHPTILKKPNNLFKQLFLKYITHVLCKINVM
jgi:hypothetical protein